MTQLGSSQLSHCLELPLMAVAAGLDGSTNWESIHFGNTNSQDRPQTNHEKDGKAIPKLPMIAAIQCTEAHVRLGNPTEFLSHRIKYKCPSIFHSG